MLRKPDIWWDLTPNSRVAGLSQSLRLMKHSWLYWKDLRVERHGEFSSCGIPCENCKHVSGEIIMVKGCGKRGHRSRWITGGHSDAVGKYFFQLWKTFMLMWAWWALGGNPFLISRMTARWPKTGEYGSIIDYHTLQFGRNLVYNNLTHCFMCSHFQEFRPYQRSIEQSFG